MSRILIADDDHNLRYSFQRMLAGQGYEFIEAADGHEAVERVATDHPDVVVMDVRMPGMDGLEAFDEIKVIAPDLPVIIMTAFGTTETAIEAMKRGAFEYLLKPLDVEEMRELVARALRRTTDHAKAVDVALPMAISPSARHQLVGSSRAMQRVYKAVGQVAESDVHVLLLGETGTGKELVARAIHEHSKRPEDLFLAINCAAIPEALIEGELFGHEKGAFTGADQRKPGLLQAAAGGTVFLDEIAEIPPGAQAKLLRFLQEGEVIRLGSETPLELDVRVIAASNRNLEDEVAQGRFRDDLYYRLSAMAITLPPLRDRLDDVEPLVAHFVNRYNAKHHKNFSHISGKTIALLKAQQWPGNVRQLENLTRKAVIVGQGPVLLPEHFFPEPLDQDQASDESQLLATVEALIAQAVDRLLESKKIPLGPTLERLLVSKVFECVGGNQVQAAKLLGISRNTLRARLERYGIRSPADPGPDLDDG